MKSPIASCAIVLTLSLGALSTVFADSATWNLNPATRFWNNPANWTPATVPKSRSDIATFDVSNLTEITFSRSTEVGGFVFDPSASSYTITVPPGSTTLVISGDGITNNSGTSQQFVLAAGRKGNSAGILLFERSATAGDATYTLNPGGQGEFSFPSLINFLDSSTAGSGTFIVLGSRSNENAIVQFYDDSDGGTARIELINGGRLLATFHSLAILIIGSLEGNGTFSQGPGETAIGSNNLDTTFAGVIGSTTVSGPISKIGTGRLTLTGANTYTGGTNVNQGALLIDNASGSGTGTKDVTVNTGTLGGDGTIAGSVTVGTGVGPASISPGARGVNDTGLLTIQDALTFGSHGAYNFQLDSAKSTADTLNANGVTIGGRAVLSTSDLDPAELTTGTSFVIIDNTAATPISGTFSNLPDGTIVSIGANNLQANYEGGDGNDLTLTVVP